MQFASHIVASANVAVKVIGVCGTAAAAIIFCKAAATFLAGIHITSLKLRHEILVFDSFPNISELKAFVSDELMQMLHFMEQQDIILGIELMDGDSQVGQMEEIIQEFPQLKVAIGHFGMVTRHDWMSQIRLARHANVFIESGGITWLFNDEFYPFPSAIKAIREAADEVGWTKLMWGSDYPRTITAITYKMSYDFVTKSKELTDEQKQLFLCDNAKRLFDFGELIELPYIKNMSE